MNLGGRGCNELRLHYCTPACATEEDSVSKKKKRREEKRKMAGVNPAILIITLKGNGLKSPFKRQRLSDRIKK